MKSLVLKIVAGVLLAASLAGCNTIIHESAMEWMERQPWTNDSPT